MGWGKDDLPRKRTGMAVVDYTLAKRAVLRGVKDGFLSVLEICDAHPELLRAAKYHGEPASRACPVCEREDLRLLTYVFGDGLKSDNGRVWPVQKGLGIAATHPGATCYVVEVCMSCNWNHLSEAFRAQHAG